MFGDRRLLMLACVVPLAFAAPCAARGQESVVELDLPTEGPQFSFGSWLQQALAGESVIVRWPDADRVGPPGEVPACIVTWSKPKRSGRDTRRLRAQVREGRGLVYVIGAGKAHINRARRFWGALDVVIEEADGGSGYAEWAPHPLTEGAGNIGSVTPGATISGVGGSPLVTVGGQPVAIAFDWGPLGRAVIIDQALIFGQLHQESPRPAMRDMLVAAVKWAAGPPPDEAQVATPKIPRFHDEQPATSIWSDLAEPGPVSPPAAMTALLDVPEEGDGWPEIRPLLVRELERAELEIEVAPPAAEGEPVITPRLLERTGVLVVGSGRESVHYTEPVEVGRFFDEGGRLLFIGHARPRSQRRMIGFNQLLSAFPITTTLNRFGGRAELVPHPITEGLPAPEDRKIRPGLRIWSPLADVLVRVGDQPAAAAWQLGDGRVVVIDGELLRPQGDDDQAMETFRLLLRRSVEWLLGQI